MEIRITTLRTIVIILVTHLLTNQNSSVCIEPRNIGNLAMHNTNHLYKKVLGTAQPTTSIIFLQADVLGFAPVILSCKCSTLAGIFFDRRGRAASSKVANNSSYLSLPLQLFANKGYRIQSLLLFNTELGERELDSYLSEGYFHISEFNELEWNSISTLRFLIPTRYTLHQTHTSKGDMNWKQQN